MYQHGQCEESGDTTWALGQGGNKPVRDPTLAQMGGTRVIECTHYTENSPHKISIKSTEKQRNQRGESGPELILNINNFKHARVF